MIYFLVSCAAARKATNKETAMAFEDADLSLLPEGFHEKVIDLNMKAYRLGKESVSIRFGARVK